MMVENVRPHKAYYSVLSSVSMACPPSRRTFLAGTGALCLTTLSGCLFGFRGQDAGFDLSLDPVGADLRTAFTLDQSELSPTQAEIVDDLRESETTIGYDQQLFDDGEILELDGSYYRVAVADDGTETIHRPVLEAELIDESEATDEPVPLDRYDDAAYDIVHPVVVTAHRGRMEPHVFYTETVRPEQLTPEPHYTSVTFQDEVYRLEISEQEIEADRIRYQWDELSGDNVEEAIREEHDIIDVDSLDLSAEAESILEAARDDPPYVGTVSFSEAEEEVLAALNSEQQDVGPDTRWIVFRGTYYEAQVHWWHGD